MKDRSDWPSTKPSDPAPEVFDRLSKAGEDDIRWIQRNIEEHLEACRRYLRANPPRTREALDQANEANMLAVAEGMTNIEPKIKFYMAECYRRQENYTEAYNLYQECAVDREDVYWLEAMQSFCKSQILKSHKDPQLRRRAGSENLQEEYTRDGVDETILLRHNW